MKSGASNTVTVAATIGAPSRRPSRRYWNAESLPPARTRAPRSVCCAVGAAPVADEEELGGERTAEPKKFLFEPFPRAAGCLVLENSQRRRGAGIDDAELAHWAEPHSQPGGRETTVLNGCEAGVEAHVFRNFPVSPFKRSNLTAATDTQSVVCGAAVSHATFWARPGRAARVHEAGYLEAGLVSETLQDVCQCIGPELVLLLEEFARSEGDLPQVSLGPIWTACWRAMFFIRLRLRCGFGGFAGRPGSCAIERWKT